MALDPGPRATPGRDAAGTGGGGADPCGGAQQGPGGHCGEEAAAGAGAGADFRIGLGNSAMEWLGLKEALCYVVMFPCQTRRKGHLDEMASPDVDEMPKNLSGIFIES